VKPDKSLPEIRALNIPDPQLPKLHQILSNNIGKSLEIDCMLRKRLHRNNGPIFMDRRLATSDYTYHDFSMKSRCGHEDLGEKGEGSTL
jgi:hypothetical protein